MPTADHPSVTVVTVTHNSYHLLDKFLRDVRSGDYPLEIVVVDSGSSDYSKHSVIVEKHSAAFYRIAENVGYGTASNVGARHSDSEWLAFVNPDVSISSDSLGKLVSNATEDGYDCLGPAVLDSSGVLTTTWHALSESAWRGRSHKPFRRGRYIEAGTISGCCMVIRRRLFEEVGGFDPLFFMFSEETDLHKRILARGGRIGVDLSVNATTDGGGSSEGVTSRWSMTERAVAHVRYTRKHFGWLAASVDYVLRLAHLFTRREFRPLGESVAQFVRGVRR
jgi:N-acetylglucosaminyl-diphospho-decaprenol L-rhamnosyltransferase